MPDFLPPLPEPPRYLVVASGPGARLFVEKHRLALADWRVVPVNHAWMLFNPGEVFAWCRSTDFYTFGSNPPDPREKEYWEARAWTEWKMDPWWYSKLRVQHTMVLNVLAHLANRHVDEAITVALACSDFVYPKNGQTHFYGTGKPDPLRYPATHLVEWLTNVKKHYEREGKRIVAVSPPLDGSLLPFDRAELEAL